MEHSALKGRDQSSKERKVYMDYNATTPLEPKVIQAVTEAMKEAWGNPSSSYTAGQKAKEIIGLARENVALMVRGRPEDIIFTSGGTEANNLVFHSVLKYFQEFKELSQCGSDHDYNALLGGVPHFITSSVEHDSVRLPLEHLVKLQVADATFVNVSQMSGQAEAEDVIAAIRPSTCLVSIMLANNETGVIMPVSKLSHLIKTLNQKRVGCGLPRILVHTDAAQALGKIQVDVQELEVDYLTIVGHKVHSMYEALVYPLHCTPCCLEEDKNGISDLDVLTLLYDKSTAARRHYPQKEHLGFAGASSCPLQVRQGIYGQYEKRVKAGNPVVSHWQFGMNRRTENTPMIAGLGKAAEMVSQHCEEYEFHLRKVKDYLEERLQGTGTKGATDAAAPTDLEAVQKVENNEAFHGGLSAEFGQHKISFNSHFPGSQCLPNTCNVSILGPELQGRAVLSHCHILLASVGAACHSDQGDRPSPILLKSGIPYDIACNALRLSVGRGSTEEDVDLVVADLKRAVAELEQKRRCSANGTSGKILQTEKITSFNQTKA